MKSNQDTLNFNFESNVFDLSEKKFCILALRIKNQHNFRKIIKKKMNLYLHFILVNSDFDQQLADEFNQGQESEENVKFLWEDELKVPELIKEYKIKNNTTYTLAGYLPNDKPFSFEIQEMTTCDCLSNEGKTIQFAVSTKLLKKTDKIVDDKKDETHLYFYLKDAQEVENPMDGIYIAEKDFPKELQN